jgi:hypothetical protein
MKTIISAIEMVFNYIFGTLMLLLVMFLFSGAWIGFFIHHIFPLDTSCNARDYDAYGELCYIEENNHE